MKNRIIAAVLSFMLVFLAAACAQPLQPAVTEKSTPGAVTTKQSPPSATTAPTESPTVVPTATPAHDVSPGPDVSDDIKAQDMCVLSYVDALKTNNADKIIQLSGSRTFGILYSAMFKSDLMGELFAVSSASDLLNSTKQFVYSILSDFPPGAVSPDVSKEAIDGFIREVDPARLKSIEVLALGTPKEKPEIPGELQSGSLLNCRYCLFSIDGSTFCQLFWLIKSTTGYNLSAIGEYNKNILDGSAKTVKENEFKALVDTDTIDVPSETMIASSRATSGETTYLQTIKETPLPSLDSKEDVTNFYVQSLARGDAYAALSAFDIKERADNFDVFKYAQRYKSFAPYSLDCMPPQYDFYRDMSLALLTSKTAERIISLLYSLSFDIETEPQNASSDYMSVLQKSCDGIATLSEVRSDIIKASTEEGIVEISRRQATAYGADDMEHRIIEYKLSGEKYTGGVTLISYGGEWRIYEQSSAFLGLDIQIPAVPSSKFDYDSYI